MKTAYRTLAHLIALLVVLQAAFIAAGVFQLTKSIDDGKTIPKDYANFGITMHAIIGETVIPVIALALLVLAFFVKVPGAVKWAAIVFGIVVLQVVLAFISSGVPGLGLLHGINALVLLGLSVRTGLLVRDAPGVGVRSGAAEAV
jgi:hypothetical protein